VVTSLHDRAPKVAAKNILSVLDDEPALDEGLMKLGEWISQYYLAPLGEVYRTMLPLAAEVRRARGYRITPAGQEALYASAQGGSSLRSRRTPAEQMTEYAVLDYLNGRAGASEAAREASLRAATKASRRLLEGMVRKKWIVREDSGAARPQPAGPQRRVALLREVTGKLNANQKTLIDTLAASGGRLAVEMLSGLELPKSTLAGLVRRKQVEIVEEAAPFSLSGMALRPEDFSLSAEQRAALAHVQAAVTSKKFSVSLIHGVTGSGKTAVYLAALQAVLAAGRSAILLVPEIGLTPAAAARLQATFGEQAAILHSGLTAGERAGQWHRIRRGEARIVVGTRSAVFAPAANLALIVVDEEQDPSYKQEETPRYHGRDVAIVRAQHAGAAVVLGSATPALETYYNVQRGKYALLELRERVEQRPLPEVEVVDMREEFRATGEDHLFSRKLVEEIRERLERGEQAMILLNRRGYSAVVLCRACGETVECQNCAIALTHHKGRNRLLCHYCGYQQAVPEACPKCSSEYVQFLGTGSEKLEERIHGAFPRARVGRLDRDTVRGRGDFERVLNALDAGELDLLVGTQMIAKGHDIHGVTLVGVVGADFALGFPDFRAAERTFQLLTQVAGRAGRGTMPGRVVLQTYHPEHYAIQFAARHDYAGFYEKELRYRKWMHYPPFTAVANVLIRSEKLEEALGYAGKIGRWFEQRRVAGLRVLGPSAAPLTRLKRDFRYHFVLKAESRERLNATLRALRQRLAEQKVPPRNVVVDVDALSLL
jgi:primosomal protein N' (replication factor Y)